MLIIGITQEPSTREYYLVFHHEIRPALDNIIYHYSDCLEYMQYSDFDELKEIGSGGYRTVYTAKYRNPQWHTQETVVLKRFKNFDQTQELFTSEVSFFLY